MERTLESFHSTASTSSLFSTSSTSNWPSSATATATTFSLAASANEFRNGSGNGCWQSVDSGVCCDEQNEQEGKSQPITRRRLPEKRVSSGCAVSSAQLAKIRQIPYVSSSTCLSTSTRRVTEWWLCRKCRNNQRKQQQHRQKRKDSNDSLSQFLQTTSIVQQPQHRRKLTARTKDNSSIERTKMQLQQNDDDLKEDIRKKKMREWAFWFIVVFLAGLTAKDVGNLIKEYCGNPKKSDMNVRFNETMRMPNITFCMSRAQAWSHFRLNGSESSENWDQGIEQHLKNMTDRESFLKQPWEFEMVMETYNLIATLVSMERETTAHGTVNSIYKFRTQERLAEIRRLTKFWLNELDKRGVRFEDFMQKVGKETLRRSMQRFQRTTYDEDLVIKTQLSITWISQMQICFQPMFDADNLKPIDDQGQFFVMILSHNAEKLNGQQVECMSADFHGRPSSSSRFMGSKGVIKDGFTDELCMGMMHETTVEVKARYKMLPNDEEGTACRDSDSDEDNEWDCYLRCRMEFIRDLCNCTAPTLSYLVKGDAEEEELKKWPICDYAQCEVDVQGRNYSDEDCTKKCHRSCDQIRFNIDHERKGKSARPDFTTVILNWGSFEYLTLEQDWVWSPTTFIAAIGGSIGMWLGLSILSLIQGSTYMYTYVTEEVIKKRRKLTIEELPKMSKTHEDKLATNPFASPFKKSSHAQSIAEN